GSGGTSQVPNFNPMHAPYCSVSSNFYEGAKQVNNTSKGSTKNVTFSGEVETIQCSSASSPSTADSESNPGNNPQSESQANQDDYCESRV
ncbi:Hypothetical protein FKW44_003824, partial [Caligus rogercresseyi]